LKVSVNFEIGEEEKLSRESERLSNSTFHFPPLSKEQQCNKQTRDHDLEYLKMQIDEAYEKIVYWRKNYLICQKV
jgi:hypothetical protein